MNWDFYIALFFIGAGAGFVQRVSGFGLGIFAMLFLPHLMEAPTAATVVVLSSAVTTTLNAIRFRKGIAFRTVLPMILATLVVLPLAVRFSAAVSAQLFKALLGGVLILLSLYFLIFAKHLRIKPNFGSGLLLGALSGLLNGLFSTGGPPAVLYLTHANASATAYFAGIQFFFACGNLYSVTVRAFSGMVTLPVLFLAAVTCLGCLSGNWCGRFVFHRLDGNKLKTVIYVGMILSGLALMLL